MRRGEAVPLCIAVVEDETPVLELLRDVLESEGFSVLPFDHPDLLERHLESDLRPDLFLIDIMLPGSTGIELAGILRQRGFAHTPMVAMSASKAMTAFAARSGLFRETLYKPFDLFDLLTCVNRNIAQQIA